MAAERSHRTSRATRNGSRLAVLAHAHPSVSKGGAEIAAYSLYRGLISLGHDAVFIAACPQAEMRGVETGGENEIILPFQRTLYDYFYHLAPPGLVRTLRQTIRQLAIRALSAHHFLNFGINSLRALAEETDVLFTFHEYLAICHHHGQMVTRPSRQLCQSSAPAACNRCFPENSRAQFEMRDALMRSVLLRAKGYVAPSDFLAQRLVSWGLPRERFAVIDNGIVSGRSAKREARLPGSPLVIGYFGQITPFKGVDVLLDAAERLAVRSDAGDAARIRIHGNLVGQPDTFIRRFMTLTSTLPVLEYAGPYDNADVRTLMEQCDYVVVPSTWWENSPLVIKEAYVAGRPVICSGLGGLAEKVVDGKTGLHFEPGSAEDLIRAIGTGMEPGLYSRLCANLPAVKDSTEMATDYLRAMKNLLRQK